MRTVTMRWFLRGFTAAEVLFACSFGRVLHRCEGSPHMLPVTERLVGGPAAGAEVYGFPCFHVYWERRALRYHLGFVVCLA